MVVVIEALKTFRSERTCFFLLLYIEFFYLCLEIYRVGQTASFTFSKMFRAFVMKAAGVRTAHANEKQSHTDEHDHHARSEPVKHDNHEGVPKSELLHPRSNRGSGIPALPADIAYHGGKNVKGEKVGASSNILGNPAVVLGMGLTTIALLGMIRKSITGDRLGAQKYMQYRIMAQFFTVTALVAGVTLFGASYKPHEE